MEHAKPKRPLPDASSNGSEACFTEETKRSKVGTLPYTIHLEEEEGRRATYQGRGYYPISKTVVWFLENAYIGM